MEIFEAFAEAKRLYLERLRTGIDQPSNDDMFFRRVMDITGDPLPYGIEPNRRMLEDVIEYALEQGIIHRRVAVDELFAKVAG